MRKLLTLILPALVLTAAPMPVDARNDCAALGLSVLQQHLKEQQALRALQDAALVFWAALRKAAPDDPELINLGPLGDGSFPIWLTRNRASSTRSYITIDLFFPEGVPDGGRLLDWQQTSDWINRYHPYQPTEGLLTDGQALEKLQAERDKARTEWLSVSGKLSELDKAYTERASEAGCPPLHEVYARSRL